MGEIKRTDQKQRTDIERKGAAEPEKGVQIVGGSAVDRSGPVKILDKNSPVEPVEHEIHIHADRKSYKDAVDKDQ
jgi:hypothetical protein